MSIPEKIKLIEEEMRRTQINHGTIKGQILKAIAVDSLYQWVKFGMG